jgi:hypothetical protein
MWQKLVENSLIGTAKLKLQKEELPPFLIEMIDKSSGSQEEATFLQVASCINLYMDAGTLPPIFKGIMDDSKFEETKAYAAKNFMKVFENILESSKYLDQEYLLQLWLNKLFKNDWIVEASKINQLLEIGNKFSKNTKMSIKEAIGKKGLWLISFRKDLNYDFLDESLIWEEGDNNLRKNLFDELRKSKPHEAMILLEKTWKTESISSKRFFLETISSSLKKEDVAFLEDLWKHEFLAKPNEKETERQCRELVINMLLRFPESEMFQLFKKSISVYFQKKKKSGLLGFVTGKEESIIELPEEEDNFWSKTNMLSIFGVFTDSGQTAIFPSLSKYWLHCFVQILPFRFWCNGLEKNMEDTLRYFLKDENFIITSEGQKYALLLGPILQNAINTKDQELIASLLKIVSKEDAITLLASASTELFEEYISKNKLWTDAQAISQRQKVEENWSLSFSKEMVKRIFEDATKNNVYLPDYIAKACSKSLHKAVLNLLEKADDNLNNYHAKHYKKVFYEPLSQFKDIILNLENYA